MAAWPDEIFCILRLAAFMRIKVPTALSSKDEQPRHGQCRKRVLPSAALEVQLCFASSVVSDQMLILPHLSLRSLTTEASPSNPLWCHNAVAFTEGVLNLKQALRMHLARGASMGISDKACCTHPATFLRACKNLSRQLKDSVVRSLEKRMSRCKGACFRFRFVG